ncbi:hypothetical protein FGRMN_2572 [Fusarium graminum]|nr:hypothetical protein FGRMN_2572 [Fusarium graminum]
MCTQASSDTFNLLDEAESYYWPFSEWSVIYRWAGYVAPSPVPVSFNQDAVADLTFNDMPFMETRRTTRNENEEFQLDTNDLPHHIEDESLDDGDSSQQDAAPSITSIQNRKEEEREAATKSLELVPPSDSLSVDHDIHGELRSSKETLQTSDSESPEVALKRLIETGIFDGTHILNKVIDRVIRQKSTERDVSNGGQENNRRYQYKGVLADPGIDMNLELSSQFSPRVKICNQGDASLTTASANTIDHGPRRSEVPLYTHSTTQVDSPALARAPAGNGLHGCGNNQNFMVESESKEETIPIFQGRWQSVSNVREGGHHSLPCTDQIDLPGPVYQSSETFPTGAHYLLYKDDTQNSGTQFAEQSLHHRQRSLDDMTPPLYPSVHQYSHSLVYGNVDIPPHSPMILSRRNLDPCSFYDDRQGESTPVAQSYCNNNQTMQEFIERIENEASWRWSGSRQTSNGHYVNGIENIAESEFPGVQDSHDALQGSNLEYYEASGSGLQTMRVGFNHEPNFERFQRELENWRNLDNQQGHHSSNRTDRELDVSELEMLAFWRPNHF